MVLRHQTAGLGWHGRLLFWQMAAVYMRHDMSNERILGLHLCLLFETLFPVLGLPLSFLLLLLLLLLASSRLEVVDVPRGRLSPSRNYAECQYLVHCARPRRPSVQPGRQALNKSSERTQLRALAGLRLPARPAGWLVGSSMSGAAAAAVAAVAVAAVAAVAAARVLCLTAETVQHVSSSSIQRHPARLAAATAQHGHVPLRCVVRRMWAGGEARREGAVSLRCSLRHGDETAARGEFLNHHQGQQALQRHSHARESKGRGHDGTWRRKRIPIRVHDNVWR